MLFDMNSFLYVQTHAFVHICLLMKLKYHYNLGRITFRHDFCYTSMDTQKISNKKIKKKLDE